MLALETCLQRHKILTLEELEKDLFLGSEINAITQLNNSANTCVDMGAQEPHMTSFSFSPWFLFLCSYMTDS